MGTVTAGWLLACQQVMLGCAVQNIFADAGVEWKWYRYFEPETVGLDFEGLMEDLRAAPEESIVVLHGAMPPAPLCCSL